MTANLEHPSGCYGGITDWTELRVGAQVLEDGGPGAGADDLDNAVACVGIGSRARVHFASPTLRPRIAPSWEEFLNGDESVVEFAAATLMLGRGEGTIQYCMGYFEGMSALDIKKTHTVVRLTHVPVNRLPMVLATHASASGSMPDALTTDAPRYRSKQCMPSAHRHLGTRGPLVQQHVGRAEVRRAAPALRAQRDQQRVVPNCTAVQQRRACADARAVR